MSEAHFFQMIMNSLGYLLMSPGPKICQSLVDGSLLTCIETQRPGISFDVVLQL